MKIFGLIFVCSLLLVSSILADEQEKIVKLTLNVTLSVDENGEAKVIMKNAQSSHEISGVGNGSVKEENFEFLDIYKLECESNSLADVVQNFTERCYDTDGISFSEKYKLKDTNYELCDQNRNECRDQLSNLTMEKQVCSNDLTSKITAAATAEADLRSIKDLNQQWVNNKWIYLILGILGVFGYQYLRDKKEKPSGGPANDGYARPGKDIKFEDEKK